LGLDAQRRLWQTEPDRALVLDSLPELRERAETIVAQAVSLRTSALPLIDEADRRSRAAAEDELRNQLRALDARPLATHRLGSTSGAGPDSTATAEESAPRP
jgi:hypothetical protein